MSAAQTEWPELSEALDLTSGRALVSGSAWQVTESGTHDGEDAVSGQTQRGNFNGITVIPTQSGTLRFWSRLSGTMRVYGSNIQQHWWDNETRGWEQHEVFVSPSNHKVFWRLYGNTQAWLDEVELAPTIPVSEALDTNHPVKLDGDWGGYLTEQSSDKEDHLRLFGRGRLDTTIIGPGVLQFRARGQTGLARITTSLNDTWQGSLFGESGDWETVVLQIPAGRNEVAIRNSGSWAGIDAFQWTPEARDPALNAMVPNSAFGAIMGTLRPVVEVLPSQQPNLGKRLRIGPVDSTFPEDEVAESEITIPVNGPGRMSFLWNMQQGAPNGSNLSVEIDGQRQATLSQFSGSWQKFTATLTPGEHLLRLRYQDLKKAAGSKVWLADLKIIARPTIGLGEAVDAPELPWWTGGAQDWAGYASLDAPNGSHLAASGHGGNRRHSWIATQVTGPGVLRCRWRCSGTNGRETLTFEDNGTDRISIGASSSMEWRLLEAEVPEGEHVLRWVFEGSYGSDDPSLIPSAGWIDAVDYTPGPLPIQEALSSNLAFAHLGQWAVVPDPNGRGGLVLQTQTPGAPLTFLVEGPGNLTGQLLAPNNTLDLYSDRQINTLGLESGWRSFSQPLAPYESFAYRLERDPLDNDGVVRLWELRFRRDQQFNALEQAAEIPKSIRILNTEDWTIDDTLSREGDTSIVGSSTLRLRVPGPGLLRFHAKALMKPNANYREPSLGWAYSSGVAPPPLDFDPASETWQTLTTPVLESSTLLITGNVGGLAVDGFEFIPAVLREQVEDHGLSLRTGGDEPWYSVTRDASADGGSYFFHRNGSGFGWVETEVTGPAVLTLNSASTVDVVVGEAFSSTLDQGYSELSIPPGKHPVRFTTARGMIQDLKLGSTPSLAEALDLGAYRYVSVSKRHEFVHGASAFDGEDALSLPEGGRLSVGFLEGGYAGYWMHNGLQWKSANEEIESATYELTDHFSGATLIDQLSVRQPLALSDLPIPLRTSVDNPWIVVPFAGVPDGDEIRLGAPARQGWLEATLEGPGELWFTGRRLLGYESMIVNGVHAPTVADYSTNWVRQRYAFSAGTHRVRWISSSSLSSIDDLQWLPQNAISKALDIDLPLVTLDPVVRTSEDGGIDGDDAVHLVGKMRFQPPASGILSWWWREEDSNEWHRRLRPVTSDYTTDISGDGLVIDRLEILDSPSFQEALDTEVEIESSSYSWTVNLGDEDFAHGPLKILAPSQGSITYRILSNGEWLTASRSGKKDFTIQIGTERVDHVQFKTDLDPFAEAIEWQEYGTLESFGWEIQSETSYTGGSALKADSAQAHLEVEVDGPGALIFYFKREGGARLGGYWDSRSDDLGNGWIRIIYQNDWEGIRTIPIYLSLSSSDLEPSPEFWIDNLTYIPRGSIDPAEAVDTDLPLTFSHPNAWHGQASHEAEGTDALRLIGSEDFTESSVSVTVEGPGTFSVAVRSENDEMISVHRGTTPVFPAKEVSHYGFTRIWMPVPAGSHEMILRFFQEERPYSPDNMDIELDHIQFIPEASPPLRSIVREPIEVAMTSGSSTPPTLSEGTLAFQGGRLYLHSGDQPGRFLFNYVGRFGIGSANAYYLSTVRRTDWGIYDYINPVGSIIVDPFYRFDSIVRLDPAAYPRFRSIEFEPELLSGDLADGLDIESAVTIGAGDWATQSYGAPSRPTDWVHGSTPLSGGSASIETQVEGPGLLRFRVRPSTPMQLHINDAIRWEAPASREWLEAATPIAAGTHLVRWQVTTSNRQGSISLDAVEVIEPPEDFLTSFGLASDAPAVRWQKLRSSGEQPVMRGSLLGPVDSGLALRINGPASVSYDHAGNLPEPDAWQVWSDPVLQYPEVSETTTSEFIPVTGEQGQIVWQVKRTRESHPGEGIRLNNIQIRSLEPLADFNNFAFQSSPALAWQQHPKPSMDASPGFVSSLTSGSSTLTSSIEGPGTLTFDWSQSSTDPANQFTCMINGEVIAQLDGEIERREGLTYHVLHDLKEGTHEIQWRAESMQETDHPIVFTMKNLSFEHGERPLESTFLNIPAMRTLMGSGEAWQRSSTWEHAQPAWQTTGPGFARLTFDLPSSGTLSGQMRLYKGFEETTLIVYSGGSASPSDTLRATLDGAWIGSMERSNYADGFSDWRQIDVGVTAGRHELRWDYRNFNALNNRAFLEAWQFTPNDTTDALTIAEAVEFDGLLTFPSDDEWEILADPNLPDGDALMVGVSDEPKTRVLETIVQGPGEIGFRWKADLYRGEFEFLVGGDPILSYEDPYHRERWSTVRRTIPSGQHVVRWAFTSPRATAGRHDPAALIDQIRFNRQGYLQEALGLKEPLLITSIITNPTSKEAWTIEGDWTPDNELAIVTRESGAQLIIDVPPPLTELTLSITGSGSVAGENAEAYPRWRTVTVEPNPETRQVHLFGRNPFFAVAHLEEPLSAGKALDTRLAVETDFAWVPTKPPGEQRSLLQSTGSGQASTLVRGPGELRFRWRNPGFMPARFSISGYEVRAIYATNEWVEEVVHIPEGSHQIAWASKGPLAELDQLRYLPLGVRETFDEWAASFALTDSKLADPNTDGIPNLLAYAFALDPTVYGALQTASGVIGSLPESHIQTRSDGDWLEMSFLRRHDSGLVYVPKFSSDLATWSSQTSKFTAIDLADGWEKVTVRDAVPIPADGRRFGHVEVSVAP